MYKLVIVDDEYIVVEGIKTIIEREKLDFEVVGCAYDGISGLELIRSIKPDVIMSDIRMPGKTGLQMLEDLKDDCDAEVILISGYQEFEYARKALQLGVKAYIDKPLTIKSVREALLSVSQSLEEKKSVPKDLTQEVYRRGQAKLVDRIRNNDMEDWEHDLEEVLSQLKSLNLIREEYKKECYKLVCLTTGIFYESVKSVQDEIHMPKYENIKDITDSQQIDLFVWEIFKSIFKKKEVLKNGPVHKTIETILLFIEENYREDIGLAEVAEMVDMHYSYLSILFKDEVGMSFVKYITSVRMRHAKQFLRDGYKVVEVANMSGFSNYRYFCEIFKKYEGMTPNEYKGTVRSKKS